MAGRTRSIVMMTVAVLVGVIAGWFLENAESFQAPVTDPTPTLKPETTLANGAVSLADGITQVDPLTLRAVKNLYTGYPARNPDGTVNAVIEIPAGTNTKWEVVPDGRMILEVRKGSPRVVNYLPYVGNYGMIPNTLSPKDQGGDGDALDILILGPALPRGSVVPVRVIGVMKFLDKGEQDDKLLAVMENTPLGAVRSLKALNADFPEVSTIVHLWFMNYKGPGKMDFQGWGEVDEAMTILDRGIAAKRK